MKTFQSKVGLVTLASPSGASVLFQARFSPHLPASPRSYSPPLIILNPVYLDFLFNLPHCSKSTGYDTAQLLEWTAIVSMTRM